MGKAPAQGASIWAIPKQPAPNHPGGSQSQDWTQDLLIPSLDTLSIPAALEAGFPGSAPPLHSSVLATSCISQHISGWFCVERNRPTHQVLQAPGQALPILWATACRWEGWVTGQRPGPASLPYPPLPPPQPPSSCDYPGATSPSGLTLLLYNGIVAPMSWACWGTHTHKRCLQPPALCLLPGSVIVVSPVSFYSTVSSVGSLGAGSSSSGSRSLFSWCSPVWTLESPSTKFCPSLIEVHSFLFVIQVGTWAAQYCVPSRERFRVEAWSFWPPSKSPSYQSWGRGAAKPSASQCEPELPTRTLPMTSCVTSGRSLPLSEPWIFLISEEGQNCIFGYLLGWVVRNKWKERGKEGSAD